VNRPYFSLGLVAVLTLAAARGGSDLASPSASVAETMETAIRLALCVVGVRALVALWRREGAAQRWTAIWAGLVLALVTYQDWEAGYLRAGFPERLAATALIGAMVGRAAWLARADTSSA
jgi:hypothetical protein